MLQETGIVYKLTFLYILHRAEFPISNTSISNFLLQSDYTDYFNIQQLISDLLEDGYIKKDQYHGKTLYSITESGETALKLLSRELSASLKADADRYLTEHNMELHDDIAFRSDYSRTGTAQVTVSLFIEEAGDRLFELKVLTPSENEAIDICNRWPRTGAKIYPLVMTELLRKN